MSGRRGDPWTVRLSGAVARGALRLYPRAFRREMGAAVAADVERRAGDLLRRDGPLRVLAWIPGLAVSLLANGAAAWLESGAPGLGRAFGSPWLDLTLGVRMLRKHPGLSVASVLAIAVAVGVGGGFTAFAYRFVSPEIPLDEGHRLVALEGWDPVARDQDGRVLHQLGAWRARLGSVRDLTAHRTVERNLVDAEGVGRPIAVAEMTPSGFTLARVPPLLGRTLVPADARPGAPPVLVIAYDVWRGRFAGDPDIVGRRVRLGRTEHEIVGVMPEGFRFPVNHRWWTPLSVETGQVGWGEGPPVHVSGRLADGADLEGARAELAGVEEGIAEAAAVGDEPRRARMLRYAHAHLRVSEDEVLGVMGGAALVWALFLLVMSANVAVLNYARTATRQGEIAVRTALGAGRARIAWQLFVEALVLAGLGAALGLAGAQAALTLTGRFQEAEIGAGLPFWLDLTIPLPVLLGVAATVVAAAALIGVVPALQATGRNVGAAVRRHHAASGLRLGRAWTAMIAVQVALAVAAIPPVVAVAVWELGGIASRTTFDEDRFLTVRVTAGDGTYGSLWSGRTAPAGDLEDPRTFAASLDEIGRRVSVLPAVADRALSGDTPGRGSSTRVVLDGPGRGGPAGTIVRRSQVDERFTGVLGLGVTAGRGLRSTDREPGAVPVVVVDRAFVEQLLGGAPALGLRLAWWGGGAPEGGETPVWREIVGVVEPMEANPVQPSHVRPQVLAPLPAEPAAGATWTLRLADGVDPVDAGADVRRTASAVDPTVRVSVAPLALPYRQERRALAGAALLVVVGILSVLALSAAGMHALLSFAVTRRRREIGIRSALGGSAGHVVGVVFGKAAVPLAIGIGAGLLAGAALDRVVPDAFSGHAPAYLASMALFMAAVGALAALGPARRGLGIEPVEAMRSE